MRYIIKVEVVDDDYNNKKKIWTYKSLKSKKDLYDILEASSDNDDTKCSFMKMLRYYIENI